MYRWSFAGEAGTAMSDVRAPIRNGPRLRYVKARRSGSLKGAVPWARGARAEAAPMAASARKKMIDRERVMEPPGERRGEDTSNGAPGLQTQGFFCTRRHGGTEARSSLLGRA